MKFLTKAAVTGLAVATATGVLVGTSGSSSAEGSKSSAYGVAMYSGGQEAVPPTPYVESTDGSTQTTGGGALPAEMGPLASGSVGTLTAGNDSASVSLTDLALGGAAKDLPAELRDGLTKFQQACEQFPTAGAPDVPSIPGLPVNPGDAREFRDLCAGVFDGDFVNLAEVGAVDISCQGDTGTVDVVDASVLSAPVEVGPAAPNTRITPDNPLLDITVNRQTKHADGSFTVDGVVVDLGDGSAELVLGSATCGTPQTVEQGPPPAGAPTPVPTPIPVTG